MGWIAERLVGEKLGYRASLVQMAASHVLHMQKAVTEMNLQIHHVISEITR